MMATSTTSSDNATDRRRKREERSIRSNRKQQSEAANRVPPPPRERRPALAALAVLLIVGGAAVAALLALNVDSREPMLVARQDIPAGKVVEESDLAVRPVAAEDTRLIPGRSAGQDRVIGQTAQATIPENQSLETPMLGTESALEGDSVAVGAALSAGRFPAGLQPGDVVSLVNAADGSGEVIVPEARVESFTSTSGAEGEVAGGSGAVATFLVDSGQSANVASAAAADSLSAVLVERGTALNEDPGSQGSTGQDDGEQSGGER